ncbi:rhomboid domain-containing protein 1 [Mytilus galloprovincialis]|uniref:Rhomboid domain-containing protein 1 n=2 Tax=Mytilus galloprovincialis TaxID=29158 RepID=A0A8B6HFD9_MYTGA|nr:rhomboid domain-containing protein 1 [Mytilus galloprovincialis]
MKQIGLQLNLTIVEFWKGNLRLSSGNFVNRCKMIVVTLIVAVLHVAVYLQYIKLIDWFPSEEHFCLSVEDVIYHKEWHPLVLATFSHSDKIQWLIIMTSFVYKSSILEKLFKATSFLVILAASTVLTSLIYVALNMGFARFFEDDSYNTLCAVGLSGVTLALKVLVNYYSPELTLSKISYWIVELAILHSSIRINNRATTLTALVSVQLAGFIAGWLILMIVLIIQQGELFIVCNAGTVAVDVEVEQSGPVYDNGATYFSMFTFYVSLFETKQVRPKLKAKIDPGREYYFYMEKRFIGGNVTFKEVGYSFTYSKYLQHRRGTGMVISMEGNPDYSKLHEPWKSENGTNHKQLFDNRL